MPALNFKQEFAEKVRAGFKRQTIRARRVDCRDPQPGQTLYLYTGMRTKNCLKLGESICKSVTPIVMINHGFLIDVILGPQDLLEKDILKLAKDDGFDNINEFFEFFSKMHGFPFYGLLIKW